MSTLTSLVIAERDVYRWTVRRSGRSNYYGEPWQHKFGIQHQQKSKYSVCLENNMCDNIGSECFSNLFSNLKIGAASLIHNGNGFQRGTIFFVKQFSRCWRLMKSFSCNLMRTQNSMHAFGQQYGFFLLKLSVISIRPMRKWPWNIRLKNTKTATQSEPCILFDFFQMNLVRNIRPFCWNFLRSTCHQLKLC